MKKFASVMHQFVVLPLFIFTIMSSVSCVGGSKSKTPSYSVTVTVSGLIGYGLWLVDNNLTDHEIVISNTNGEFTFPSKFSDGHSYNIVVAGQPNNPSQFCTVYNGSGVVSGADINNISVVCENIYTISGTVTGLVGSGLEVQNNGGDDLAITVDGDFIFSTKYSDGTGYNVTVKTQPYALSQTCSVNNGLGTFNGADVTNVSIVCVVNSYTIGGSVTGLTSSGMILQNNGGDDLAITADGSFTFATALLDGSSYNVTVLSQPTGQTCLPSNTIGTLAGSDVTKVYFTCVQHYTVGGSVSGLTGSGMVLQNNGGDELAINVDGIFTFATDLPDTTGYNITVSNQPTGQTCTTSNALGTLAGADVTNVEVRCSRVSPLYTANGYNWNDYVQGADITTATDTACDAATDTACLHAGEIRMLELTGVTSCAGITASDALGAFNWDCDESTGTARVFSYGLSADHGLVDLLDFTTPGWKLNSLTIHQDAVVIDTTSAATWWSNPVISVSTGGYLNIAGAVYVIPEDVLGWHLINANSIALVAPPGVVIYGPASGGGSTVVSANGKHLWLEGLTINAAGDDEGVMLSGLNFSVIRDLTTRSANIDSAIGFYLGNSSHNKLSNIKASDNLGYGIYISGSFNTITDVIVNNNGAGGIYEAGVRLLNASDNILTNVIANNNNSAGIRIDSGSNTNKLSSVTSTNNTTHGIYLNGALNNAFSDVTVTNNGEYGLILSRDSIDNTFSSVTSNNNGTGIYLDTGNINFGDMTSNNVFTGLNTSNNLYGTYLNYSGYNTFENLVTSHNGNHGIDFTSSPDNYFTGEIKVGNNDADCDVTGADPGLVTSTCANSGVSDAILTSGVSVANSFIAKITTDDSVNSSDANGAASYPAAPELFDWTGFENSYRGWGIDGSAFPNADNRGRWTSGNGRIWDWSMLSNDTVIRDVLVLPTGNDTITHIWSDLTTTTFLRNAVEVQGDSIGNDNALCESNETCLFTPNIGSYQGHGNLINIGNIGTGGALENIILMKHETNGYN